jgi:hypothetical protein
MLAASGYGQSLWRPAPGLKPKINTITPSPSPLWAEFGLKSAEEADFGKWRATAYRFDDPTGAYAAGRWQEASHPGTKVVGTLVVTCSGECPKPGELAKDLDPVEAKRVGYPTLPGFLPKGAIAGSERYILGPASLTAFAPGLPADRFGFQFSAEAVVARYPGGVTLVLASYPTPSIARQVMAGLAGFRMKRTGSLVEIAMPGPGDEAVTRVMGNLRYAEKVTFDEKPPDPSVVHRFLLLILAIFKLIGFLLVLCVVGGLVVAGGRLLAQRFGYSNADDAFISLHLTGK